MPFSIGTIVDEVERFRAADQTIINQRRNAYKQRRNAYKNSAACAAVRKSALTVFR